MKKTLLFITIVAFTVIGCSKTNEVAESGSSTGNPGGGGNTTCDTVNMKYLANVQPIIAANCYSCHGNGLSQNGVSLDSYSKVKQQVSNGQLIGVITHAAGYTPMPYGKAKLSDCDINKIRSWINWGALNN
jgi:hypothetical protein